jgi:hypothetical protein
MSRIEFPNMRACVEDSRNAVAAKRRGPDDPTDFRALLRRLAAAARRLPRLYRQVVLRPYVAELEGIGPADFKAILDADPNREGEASLLLDIAHAILQNGDRYEDQATDAFQEVVADLYDGFLSAEDRAGVKPPDHGVIAPLVKWGSPESGPYTWPVDDTSGYGAMAGIVSLPPSHTSAGLMGWSALSHETAGHDILHADDGLLLELKRAVRVALENARLPRPLPTYWSSRIDETASDVLGILNMGPAAGIGIIAYFRGFSRQLRLSTEGEADDPHPADVLRGWLASETVRLLSFRNRDAWAEALSAETDADAGTSPILLEETRVSREAAVRSAGIVAGTLVNTPLECLEGRALGRIQDWADRDEKIVLEMRRHLRSNARAKAYKRVRNHYAAHVVAAAVYEALRDPKAEVGAVHGRMLTILEKMHNANPAWGPLFLSRAKAVRFHLAHRRPQGAVDPRAPRRPAVRARGRARTPRR